MRRALILVGMIVALAGCGGGDDGGAAQEGAADAIKVGLVTDVNQLNDRGFNHLAYVGLQRAQRELGVKITVAQSRSRAEYIPNLASLARKDYDLVIGVGFDSADAVDTVATRFPQTKFAIIDVANEDLKHKPKNVLGLLFREHEVGYLAGYLAGLEVKREPGADVISTVAGQKQPPVDRFIAGYQAGAREANPNVKLLNDYSQDWVDQAKCKQLALNQIAEGSRIIFQVAGGCGLGALAAAGQENVWGIGVDADQSFLGDHILTSAVKRVDEAVFLTVKSVENATFRGGRSEIFGLEDNGVGLGRISPRVQREDMEAVARVRKDVIAGRVKIPTELAG